MQSARSKRPIRILTIDGGGVRGIIPASIVLAIEYLMQRRKNNNNIRIADYFDVIGGTSTGGVLAGLYLMPSNANVADLLKELCLKYKYSAAQVLDFYLTQASNIFKQTWTDYCWSFGGWYKCVYSAASIEEVLKKYTGEIRLEELNKRFMAMAYNTDTGEPHLFTSSEKDRNYYLRDVLRATTAAPTYFPIAQIKLPESKYEHYIDGGMVANNPSSAIVSKVQETDPEAPIMLVSISCGRMRDPYPYAKAVNWGKIEWATPAMNILMDANSRDIDISMRERLRTNGNYFRFDAPLVRGSIDIDNISPQNLENLRADAVTYLQEADVQLMVEQIVELLDQ